MPNTPDQDPQIEPCGPRMAEPPVMAAGLPTLSVRGAGQGADARVGWRTAVAQSGN